MLTILLHTPLNPEGGSHVISFVGSMRGASLPRRSWYGIAGAALLIASGAIHLDLYVTGYNSIPTIGPLFLLQIISAFLLAVVIPLTGLRLAYAAGAGFGLGTLGGYLLTLKVGLFGFTEVRTTAGIVAAIIDVAAFAVLGAGAVSGLGIARRARWGNRQRRPVLLQQESSGWAGNPGRSNRSRCGSSACRRAMPRHAAN